MIITRDYNNSPAAPANTMIPVPATFIVPPVNSSTWLTVEVASTLLEGTIPGVEFLPEVGLAEDVARVRTLVVGNTGVTEGRLT